MAVRGFILVELIVALIVTATILLGAFTLLVSGSTALSRLDRLTTEQTSLEAALASLRTDLQQAKTTSDIYVTSQKSEDNEALEISFQRFVIDPVIGKPSLATISWSFGPDGIERIINIPRLEMPAKRSFLTKQVAPKLSYIGADLWQLTLKPSSNLSAEEMMMVFDVNMNSFFVQ